MTDSIVKRLFFHWYMNWYWYIFAFIILIFVLVAIFTLNIGYSWDESIYLLHTDILSGRDSSFNEFAFRPILFSIILIPFYQISDNLIFLRIIMICFSLLVLFCLFLLFSELFSFKIAIILTALFSISPWVAGISQYILTDIFVLLFIIPGIYFSYKYYNSEDTKHLIYASILFGFAFLTRFFYGSFLILLILILIAKYESIKKLAIGLIFAILPFIIVILPYLIYSKYVFGGFLTTVKNGQLLVSFNDAPWYIYFQYLPEYWFLLIIAVIFGVYYLYKRRSNYLAKFYILIAILFVFHFIYFSLTPHKEPRYAIPLAFDLLFIAGFGIAYWFRTKSAKIKQFVLKIVLFILLASGILILFGFFNYYVPLEERQSVNMLPINYITDLNVVGTIYTNTDVPQYIYLFPENKVVNLYWYNLNDLNYNNLFTDNGILVDNTLAKKLDLNFLDGNLKVLKEFSPYTIYEVKVK